MKMVCGDRGLASIAVLVAVAVVMATSVLGVVDGPAVGPSSVTAAGSTTPPPRPAALAETTAQLSGTTSALGADPATLYDRGPYPEAPAGDTALSVKKQVFLQAFASDLPLRTAATLWARQRPATARAFTTRCAAAAWLTSPSWYVSGTADKIITPESELLMAHRARARILLVSGGSHLTLISHPEAVTKQILAAAHATCSSSERTGGTAR